MAPINYICCIDVTLIFVDKTGCGGENTSCTARAQRLITPENDGTKQLYCIGNVTIMMHTNLQDKLSERTIPHHQCLLLTSSKRLSRHDPANAHDNTRGHTAQPMCA
jgi:hypothetical protein